jgi:TolB-like protein/DNA-binding winged helix-turn-helix (wHTH) protein/Flp pilus assembly protein TadD
MEVPARFRRVRFGVFDIDLHAGELLKNGLKIKLQEQPFQILTMLLSRPGEVVTRQELREKLWPSDTFVDFDAGLNTVIKRLRDTLDDPADRPRYIETVPRKGYRFIGSLQGSPGLEGASSPFKGSSKRESLVFRRSIVVLLILLAVAAVSATGVWYYSHSLQGQSGTRARSLAVLPFENLSGNLGEEYFVDGMTDELITSLAKVSSLRVISRTSVMRYKGAREPLRQIARELNVDAIVEGSVVKSGSHVRVTAQLIDASTDRHVWADSYTQELGNVVSLQNQIAAAITGQIQAKLTPEERQQLARARPVNPEAHEAYLKGRYFWNRRTEKDLEKAIQYFEEAIQKDPNYAPAYAGMADAHMILGSFALNARRPDEVFPKAEIEARKALELDETLAEAHDALGSIRTLYDWDRQATEREYKRALELNPSYATAHQLYGLYLSQIEKHDEAIAETRRALQLDPLSVAISSSLGLRLYFARRYDQAIKQFGDALELDSNHALAHLWLGQTHEQKGNHRQAIIEIQKAVTLSPGSALFVAELGHAYGVAGQRNEALKVLDELHKLSKDHYVSAYDQAIVYLGLGEKEQVFAWLQKAVHERSPMLVNLKVDPALDPLRSDARFRTIMQRVGLQP